MLWSVVPFVSVAVGLRADNATIVDIDPYSFQILDILCNHSRVFYAV
ncbi:MAG: hypothetical protein NVS9B9_28760 [Ktedonobacteraceae bacterium]